MRAKSRKRGSGTALHGATCDIVGPVTAPRRLFRNISRSILKRYVQLQNGFARGRDEVVPATGSRPLDEIARRASTRTDISDHLVTLFTEALAVRPHLIVELGVRGGESTFVFERVATLTGAKLLSIDIDDCIRASSYPGWTFVRSDDVAFAAEFPSWCGTRGVEARIDVLFIDTSHLLEHTAREIEVWFPYLSGHAKVFFHDTNLQTLYRRKDGSLAVGWDNERGVIAALERWFGTRFDESEEFVALRNGWIIRHTPWSAGLTILERVFEGAATASTEGSS